LSAVDRISRCVSEIRSTPNSAMAAWDAPHRSSQVSAAASRAVVDS